ncbi:MAG TPA: AI-2E family transporter [Solirubrobacteraceae bacterium]
MSLGLPHAVGGLTVSSLASAVSCERRRRQTPPLALQFRFGDMSYLRLFHGTLLPRPATADAVSAIGGSTADSSRSSYRPSESRSELWGSQWLSLARLTGEPGAAGAPIRSRVAYRAVVLALALLAGGLLFEQLVDLFLLITMSVVIALPIAAGAGQLQRLHIPRALGAVLTLAAVLGIAGIVLAFVVPAFIEQIKGFIAQLPRTVTHLEKTANHAFGLKPGTASQAVARFADRYEQHPSKLLGPLSTIGLTVTTAAGAIVIVLISSLYMAINPDPLIRGLLLLFPPDERANVVRTLERVRVTWLGWQRGVVLDMLVLGGLLYAGMQIIGLPFAIGFAIFSALMTVIPNYGSIISAVPPIAYGLTFSLHQALLVTAVYVVVNQIEGNLLLPLIMGRIVRLHPAVIAIGVLITGALFGLLGLFISVPLITLTLILVDELWVKRHISPAAPASDQRPSAADAP